MDDDYNYDEPEIVYNPDEVIFDDNEDMGLNYEDLFLEAQYALDIDKFREIISLEKDNSDSSEWGFKSYEQICILYVRQKDLDQFKANLEGLISLYTKVDDCHKQETITKFCDELRILNDDEFALQVLEYMLNLLTEKEIDRGVINTGTQFAKILFHLNRVDELETVSLYP
jgi:hypothetical protein